MLILRDVVAGYGGSRAVDGVSMTADDTGITAIIGRSGAGKTALTNVIGGLLPAISGQLLYAGRDITATAVRERVALGIRYVPSGRQLFSGMTLLENLQLGAMESAPGEFGGGLDLVFTVFPELQPLCDEPAAELPASIQRFATFGRALVRVPKLLVLDQPSLGLNGEDTLRIYRAISDVRREWGIAVLLTEQKMFQALKLAETVYRMDKGRIDGEHVALELLADRGIQAEFPGIEVCAT
ncbi:MAG TPA: ATP-binding cassette domain-containing protein [Micropepsaceae bacterium]|nr:ATP-binding cassette domain-containing protein [Micropepsaceae bacterium]